LRSLPQSMSLPLLVLGVVLNLDERVMEDEATGDEGAAGVESAAWATVKDGEEAAAAVSSASHFLR
jgi:hypothetical protein